MFKTLVLSVFFFNVAFAFLFQNANNNITTRTPLTQSAGDQNILELMAFIKEENAILKNHVELITAAISNLSAIARDCKQGVDNITKYVEVNTEGLSNITCPANGEYIMFKEVHNSRR